MTNIDMNEIPASLRLEEITWTELGYRRPRIAGKNARLDVHGWGGKVPVAQIQAGGWKGFGWCTLSRAQAQGLVGQPIRAMFGKDGMLKEAFYGLEFPLLDFLGNFFSMPVYQLIEKAPQLRDRKNFSVPVYDTTIYFDELHIQDDKEAVDFICGEVSQGLAAGHRHFKVKIGRPGMWMDYENGLRRDVEIVHAIRAQIGPDAKLMVDANNGYNLNITKAFLAATKKDKLHWLEEAFHEDDVLYSYLREWMKENGIATLIADGEGYASTAIEEWAKKGLVDVLQYDLRGYGFFRWMRLCQDLEPYGTLCAPHNYGGFYGNYAQAHFAAATDAFAFAEFDVAEAEGIDTTGYQIREGMLEVPKVNGFGLMLDEACFQTKAQQGGWRVCAL